MKYKGIIYKAYCLQTQKVYIGQTRQDFNKRKRSHINESFNENIPSYNYHFHRAIRKYGIDQFEWTILEILEANSLEALKECLDLQEIKYIKLYDSFRNGYNSTPGGNQNDGILKKVSIYNSDGILLQRYNSCEEASNFFKNVSSDSIRDSCLKKRQFIYQNGTRYIIRYSDYTLTKQEIDYIKQLKYSIPIIMINSDGNIVAKFNSGTDAENKLGINKSKITNCCNKSVRCTTIQGKIYTFRYENDFTTLSNEDIQYMQNKTPSGTKIIATNSSTQQLIGIYNTIKEASEALCVNQSSIHQCCKGKRKTGGKINGCPIIWSYLYENN